MSASKIFLIALLLVLNCALAQQPSQPIAVVETLQTALIDVMKNAKSLGFKGRFDQLAPVIEQTHDLPYIARFAIGKRWWDRLNAEQQKRYVEVFSNYSIATYASRFNDFDGESFQVESEKSMKRGRVRVSSYLKTNNTVDDNSSPGSDGLIDFNYVLRENKDRWQIINIIVQGVSDLALKRAEYKTLISDKGLDALIKHIEQKTQAYTESNS